MRRSREPQHGQAGEDAGPSDVRQRVAIPGEVARLVELIFDAPQHLLQIAPNPGNPWFARYARPPAMHVFDLCLLQPGEIWIPVPQST